MAIPHRLLILLAALWLLLLCATALASPEDYDVRTVYWGMSKAEVQTGEEGQLMSDNGDWILYADQLFDAPARIKYSFADDQLCKILIRIFPKTEEQAGQILRILDGRLAALYSNRYPELGKAYGGIFEDSRTQAVLFNNFKHHHQVSVSFLGLDLSPPSTFARARKARILQDLNGF